VIIPLTEALRNDARNTRLTAASVLSITIIVLPLEAGLRKFCGARAQPPVASSPIIAAAIAWRAHSISLF
jgi:hypothetical protein